jgi:hypothetical protein
VQRSSHKADARGPVRASEQGRPRIRQKGSPPKATKDRNERDHRHQSRADARMHRLSDGNRRAHFTSLPTCHADSDTRAMLAKTARNP